MSDNLNPKDSTDERQARELLAIRDLAIARAAWESGYAVGEKDAMKGPGGEFSALATPMQEQIIDKRLRAIIAQVDETAAVSVIGVHSHEQKPGQPSARSLEAHDSATKAKEAEPPLELWICETCGKEFDRKTFSHARAEDDGHGNPVPVECGPISKREADPPQLYQEQEAWRDEGLWRDRVLEIGYRHGKRDEHARAVEILLSVKQSLPKDPSDPCWCPFYPEDGHNAACLAARAYCEEQP